jgi:hypothetical protein
MLAEEAVEELRVRREVRERHSQTDYDMILIINYRPMGNHGLGKVPWACSQTVIPVFSSFPLQFRLWVNFSSPPEANCHV